MLKGETDACTRIEIHRKKRIISILSNLFRLSACMSVAMKWHEKCAPSTVNKTCLRDVEVLFFAATRFRCVGVRMSAKCTVRR